MLRNGMYCTDCGRHLVDGRCPVHGRTGPEGEDVPELPRFPVSRRSGVWVGIALALVGVVSLGAVGLASWAVLSGRDADKRLEELTTRIDRVTSILEEQRTRLDAVAARTERLARNLGREFDPEAIAEQAKPAVFLIEALGSQGSGFVASSGPGRSSVITNLHVVETAWEAGAPVRLRQGDRTYEGTVASVSQAEDLAVISVSTRLPALDLARREPEAGEEVVVVGAPLGLEHTVVTGVVSGHRDQYLQISAPISPGDSGAPVLDASGRVVGVAVSKFVGVAIEGISFAIPVDTVCRTVLQC